MAQVGETVRSQDAVQAGIGVSSQTSFSPVPPALLTRISMPPSCSIALSAMFCASPSTVRSPRTTATLPPCASMSAATAYVRFGCRPIHGRQPKRTYAVAADIEAHGGRVAVVLGDLTVEGEAQNIADSAIEQLGGIDILVNNAGGTGEKLVWEDTPIRAWTESYERNVLAAVRLISRLLLPMRQSGWGRIVNVARVAGVMPQPSRPDSLADKTAINNLSLSLTKALGASGVTVNTVSPGMILTPKLEEVFRQMATTNGWVASDASWEEIERAFLKVSQVPLGRIGRVDEVAHAVVFLCSPLASYITGADLRIDGGVVPAL